MKKIPIQSIRKSGALLVAFFLVLLLSEEILVLAQGIRNQSARMDVRGTSRRTARRVNRRHDYWQSGSSDVYVESAPAEVIVEDSGGGGEVIYSLPGGCIDNNGIFDCNGIRYQAQMQGSTVVYIRVN